MTLWSASSRDMFFVVTSQSARSSARMPPTTISPAHSSVTVWLGALVTLLTVLLTWGDTVSDWVTLEQLLRADSPYFLPMLGMLVFANVVLALAAYFYQRDGVLASLAALVGLKPLVDGVRIIFSIESKGRKFDPSFNFALTRAVETGIESIPQAILQALALSTTRSPAQYISLAWSIMNIAYTFVSVSFSMDTSEVLRAMQPRWYGFVDRSSEVAMGVALGLFELGYVCSKLLAVAALGSVEPIALAAWLVGELAALLLARAAIGNWRLYSAVGDSTIYSLLWHLGEGLLMLAAPFPVMRSSSSSQPPRAGPPSPRARPRPPRAARA